MDSFLQEITCPRKRGKFIRVLADGRVKILDFGSGRYLDDNDRLTEIGTILGTLAYLAPEVLEGQTPRAASDIYGFGVLAYELLSFRRPFDAPSFSGLSGFLSRRLSAGLSVGWRQECRNSTLWELVFQHKVGVIWFPAPNYSGEPPDAD